MWILVIRKLVWKKVSQNLRTANTCLNFLISTLPWNSTRLTFWSRRKFEAYQSKHNIKNKKSDTWSWGKKFLPSYLIISILVNKYFWITYWHHNLAVIKGNNCRKIYLMMYCRCTRFSVNTKWKNLKQHYSLFKFHTARKSVKRNTYLQREEL